jgi:hypothetical protein
MMITVLMTMMTVFNLFLLFTSLRVYSQIKTADTRNKISQPTKLDANGKP